MSNNSNFEMKYPILNDKEKKSEEYMIKINYLKEIDKIKMNFIKLEMKEDEFFPDEYLGFIQLNQLIEKNSLFKYLKYSENLLDYLKICIINKKLKIIKIENFLKTYWTLQIGFININLLIYFRNEKFYYQNNIDFIKNNCTEYMKNIQKMRIENYYLKRELKSLENENDNLNEDLNKLSNDFLNNNEIINKMKKEIDELTNEDTVLKNQIDQIKSILKSAQQNNSNILKNRKIEKSNKKNKKKKK